MCNGTLWKLFNISLLYKNFHVTCKMSFVRSLGLKFWLQLVVQYSTRQPALDIHFAEHALGPMVQLGSSEVCWAAWGELTLAVSHGNAPESCSKLLRGTRHHLPQPYTSGQGPGPRPLAAVKAGITNPAQVSLASSLVVSSITLAQKTGG